MKNKKYVSVLNENVRTRPKRYLTLRMGASYGVRNAKEFDTTGPSNAGYNIVNYQNGYVSSIYLIERYVVCHLNIHCC